MCCLVIAKSLSVPVTLKLSHNENLDYPAPLRKRASLKEDILAEEINRMKMDTRSQPKGAGFFRHRAGTVEA